MHLHHIQQQIIDDLVGTPTARFAELKPGRLEGNIFTYHLQQLLKAGLVVRTGVGSYGLTATGRAVGIHRGTREQDRLRQAHPIFLLAIRDAEGRWLLRRRTVHPMYGRIGFLHGEPTADAPLLDTARRRLADKSGLSVHSLEPRGAGYIRIFIGDELESFVQFTLLTGTAVDATSLTASDETGQNFWSSDSDGTLPRSEADMLVPSMPDLLDLLRSDGLTFADLTYRLDPPDPVERSA